MRRQPRTQAAAPGEGAPLGGGRAPPALARRDSGGPKLGGRGHTRGILRDSALTRTLAGGAARGHTDLGCQARLAR
jgi:hypothetical protein